MDHKPGLDIDKARTILLYEPAPHCTIGPSPRQRCASHSSYVPPAEATLCLMACALVLIQYGAANFTANYGHEAGGAQVPFSAAHVPARAPPTPPRSSIPRGDLDDLTPWQGPRRSLWLVHSRGRGCRLVSSKNQVLHVQILFLPFFLALSRSFVLRLPSSRRPASLPATRYQGKQFAL